MQQMTEKPTKTLTYFETIKEILELYGHSFKYIIWLVVLASLVQTVVSTLMPKNPVIGSAVSILESVVSMFFYAWILYQADSVYMKRTVSINDSLRVARKRFLYLLGLVLLYIALVLIVALFATGLYFIGQTLHIEYVLGAIGLLLFIYIISLLAFSMPALVLDGLTPFKSMMYSVQLIWKHWWRVFSLFILFLIPVFLLSLSILLLNTRNLWLITLYEFIFNIIMYPLMISLVLVLYHDLKERFQVAGFKHMTDRSTP